MNDLDDAVNLALLIARVWMGVLMFAHGWRHLQSVRSGPGMANWFESLGLNPVTLHAWIVTLTELGVGALLIVGFLTPLAYAGTASIVLVALVTNHRKNGFWINNPGEGYEYVATVAVLSIALGVARTGGVVARPRVRLRVPLRADDGAGHHRDRRHRRDDRVPRHLLAAAEEDGRGEVGRNGHQGARTWKANDERKEGRAMARPSSSFRALTQGARA